MNRTLVAWMVLGLARSAAAQAPGQVEPVAAPFLEKRVPEELATEGVVLSRRNLGLQIEQLGDKWLVSLVDLTTGRVAASTKVDVLPADREAAVAAMTHVVAELASQIVGHAEPPPPPAPEPKPAPPQAAPAPPTTVIIDDRAERAARDVAELKYKRQSIRFGESYHVAVSASYVSVHRRWIAFQGDLDQELEPVDFYATVGRPDLGDAYMTRRHVMIGGYVVMAVGYLVALAVVADSYGASDDCPILDSACRDQNKPDHTVPLIAFGIGTVGMGVGLYLHFHPHPIEENEAKSLADSYNQGLRVQLGLPVVSRRPLLRDMKLVPYVTGHQGGLALTGRF
jgi:hypothetical protein